LLRRKQKPVIAIILVRLFKIFLSLSYCGLFILIFWFGRAECIYTFNCTNIEHFMLLKSTTSDQQKRHPCQSTYIVILYVRIKNKHILGKKEIVKEIYTPLIKTVSSKRYLRCDKIRVYCLPCSRYVLLVDLRTSASYFSSVFPWKLNCVMQTHHIHIWPMLIAIMLSNCKNALNKYVAFRRIFLIQCN